MQSQFSMPLFASNKQKKQIFSNEIFKLFCLNIASAVGKDFPKVLCDFSFNEIFLK